MELSLLPILLGAAWLVPLVSFAIISVSYSFPQAKGKQASYASSKFGGYLATTAILVSAILSFTALFVVWLPNHPIEEPGHHSQQIDAVDDSEATFPEKGEGEGVLQNTHEESDSHATRGSTASFRTVAMQQEGVATEEAHDEEHHANNGPPEAVSGDWYTLCEFGDPEEGESLKITIGYYIDALTVAMFCVVTLIASCVHFYSLGYMHDELHDYTDPEVTLTSGEKLKRHGRFHRFFQYLSLFCFSMLGIVIAGNVAMVFVFWELVGICSYFLIGFYIERHSASTAANKAFIVNRVGDFGMLIGMMALWSSLGTFSFGDMTTDEGVTGQGIFSQLRTPENEYHLVPPENVVAEENRMFDATDEVAADETLQTTEQNTAGQWLLFIAGVGIFCGCVGKSAQFPLHVWLPDAMEGPTPVSALVHSATMVAAGVYLVGRMYPIFTPEALLVIAVIGCITLLIAATIAITAVDIKRVLAYSTVSQLGYMMLALGLGGWVAGMFHLITHAFFKGLLFLCSGSVIHAVHTNDMREMGGLRKKMPITAYTMLAGCLAIIGAGIPLVGIGFSGYYSKDAIIEMAWIYGDLNEHNVLLQLLKWMPVVGAMITAFYMFRLWYMTFAGEPRDHHRYDHAHESPRVMTYPLILLALFAVGIGWSFQIWNLSVTGILEQARPVGTEAATVGTLLPDLTIPNEHTSHEDAYRIPAGLWAFGTALAGLILATIIYLWGMLNPRELKASFQPVHGFLWHKWWFDELYWAVFVAPTLLVSWLAAKFDRRIIDGIIHSLAALFKGGSKVVDAVFDRTVVDGTVNTFARGTWDFGLWLRRVQTGNLRQYVMFIVVGTVFLFIAIQIVQDFMITG